ncbi:hypothetical protein DFH07DRAFT_805534 [Mycena maculata]|uniref:Transcription factor tau subunit sfc3/Tfc3 C-terminal domain-containing protein n=1 Tax=Mycena maculata TaxID=230809 RepID=A0AAD7JSC8_9AGAR|nr:hypothetical protein DFH07DRAFT_805534 [Mycena maculata]
MDELLHHCLRELSFDGDLGCNVSRLRDFVVDFYAHSTTTSTQNPDDAFCAFIWSLVVQQPTVIVGIIPEGITSEVWIAPQNSAKRKAKAKGEETVEVDPPRLDIVPDARNRSLDDLKVQYGDKLRLAADPEATYAAITGTHIRFPKMSPMVYSALQIITRGRDAGVSVVELGQKSKYDQKTCFYLVRQLTELDLVVKVRRGGVGSHFCIHKYFFDRSESWKEIREEETRAAAESEAPPQTAPTDTQDEDGSPAHLQTLNFTPIDARHLSSMPLVKARIIKLLKASKNSMHASNNMLVAIGFARPTKTDRRFFASRTRELVEQRVIENVFVPSKKRNATNGGVKCFRLVSADPGQTVQEGVVVQQSEDDAPADEQSGIKMNVTIHKQIITLLEDACTAGMTLNELAAALCQFDKRTIELLLTRAEKYPPPAHLVDLGIACLMETSGRERRNRYFTIASYHALVAQENLDKSSAGYADIDFQDVGGFLPVGPEAFWTEESALHKHQDRDARTTRATYTGKKPRKNPVLPDGTVKKGRPRKARADDDDDKPRRSRKRKQADDEAAGLSEPKKGRPAKKRRLDTKQEPADEPVSNEPSADPASNQDPIPSPDSASNPDPIANGDPSSNTAEPPAPPKRRGRPPRPKGTETIIDFGDAPPPAKKRGRGKKAAEPAPEPASAPKKRGRRSEPNAANGDVGQGAGINSPDSQNAPSPLAKRPRLQSPAPVPGLETPLTPLTPLSPLTPPVDFIPPVATLNTQSSAASCQSSPLSALSDELNDKFDELKDDKFDEPKDDDDAQAAAPEDAMNPAPLSPALLTFSLPEDMSMPDDSNMPDSTLIPIDPVLNGASELVLPEPSFNGSAIRMPVAVTPAIKQKVNVSSLRRENELFRVLELLGGVLNTQTKDVYDSHQALIVSLSQAGEPTSAPPGTRLDRRTATGAFNNMELRGRVKQLKTTVSSLTGFTRPANLVYLPDLEESKIAAFLAELSRNMVHFPPVVANAIVVDEHTEYGSKGGRSIRNRGKAIPFQLIQAAPRPSTGKGRVPIPARADELFSYDEETIREVLLTERTTVGQMYGFIVGKLIRSREFHLRGLKEFDARLPSANIVSHEKRIASFPFFYNDIPVGLYCALVPALDGSDDLARLLATKEGRKIPVRELPSSIHSLLQIGRTRGRGRILELLDILRSLGLAVPLEACESGEPFITCEANGDHPMSFQIMTTEGWSQDATGGAPDYWHFTSAAPVYHWAESEMNPPFLQDIPVTSCADAVHYWDFLRTACSDRGLASQHNWNEPPRDMTVAKRKAKTIRRRVSWIDGYSFTWHQTYYLSRFVNIMPDQIPLHLDEGAAEKIQNICRVISAPEHAVREHLAKNHESKVLELEKAKRRVERELQNKILDEDAKASLAQKAAAARAQREAKWDSLMQKIHPEPLDDAAAIRLRRVRTLFLQATGMQTAKWERDIIQAVHEADMATTINSKRFRWKKTKVPAPAPAPAPLPGPIAPLPAPPVVANPQEKPIATLIAMQGPMIIEKVRPKRSKNLQPEAPPTESVGHSGPRNRFHWTKDYEELAKDAFAIIHSRCRSRGKVDYSAIKQVFPGVPKASLRNRMKALREVPTMAAYLSRLEDHWHELWTMYRGSALLLDEDPLSLKFDLIAHIEFLRKHIDKSALRVGFAQVEDKAKNIIPASVDELLDKFDVVETPGGAPPWDFMWSAIVEEGREKRALRQAFTTRSDDLVLGTENSSDNVLLAESVLKMVVVTAQESYNAETASEILHTVGAEPVNAAQKNLLSRGVLAKRFKNPGSHPGRQLKISDINQNAIGGSISSDTFQDATALEEISVDDQAWREWPVLSTDGDTAALIQLVSDNKVDFKIDTSHAQQARVAIDWNSKKADDDHIETAIFVRFHDVSIPQTPNPIPAPALPTMEVETITSHGTTEDGSPACCKRENEDSLIDCPACLEEEWGAFYASTDHEERDKFQLILDTVSASGAKGITKHDLMVKTGLPEDVLFAAVGKIAEWAVPPMFWAGYASLVLVASSHLRNWTVQISPQPLTRIFPRRWIDMSGSKVIDLWEAAARAVIGVLVFHPGVTQAQLRWRLRSVYDRQEVNEILRYLSDAGFVAVRGDVVLPADDEEEKHACLFVGDRHWYQV